MVSNLTIDAGAGVIPGRNPYVGPRPFQKGEKFYGREREKQNLFNLLLAERIVLLYSPSGAGKTSLLQAGLLPRLGAEGLSELPILRLNREPGLAGNRYLLSVISSLEDKRLPERRIPAAELVDLSFNDYLTRLTQEDELNNPLLIFDQFEEILTIDPLNDHAREKFFDQVGEALRVEGRWALFSTREDFLGPLDPYLWRLPTRLRSTFRLDLLDAEAALLAVREPAREEGVEYEEDAEQNKDAARQLVDNLRRIRVKRPVGEVDQVPGRYVEPVQLQVVCTWIWDKLPPGTRQITEANVQAADVVDRALAAFYARAVQEAAKSGVAERAIREWFERKLVTAHRTRGQVQEEPLNTGGLDNTAISLLVNAHVVRAEHRREATWYELSHDRLIEPMLSNNADWFRTNLSPLQQQATLWNDKGRPKELLFQGPLLEEAETWATENPQKLDKIDDTFLTASRDAREVARREARSNKRIHLLFRIATILAIVAILSAIAAGVTLWRLRAAQDETVAQELAAAAFDNIDTRLDSALLFGLLATHRSQVPRARGSLLASAMHEPRMKCFLQGLEGTAHAIVVAPGGTILAAGDDGLIHIWEPGGCAPDGAAIAGQGSPVYGLTLSRDGKLLASGGADGRIVIWELASRRAKAILPGGSQRVVDLAFSPDGSTLASGDSLGRIVLWDLAAGVPVWPTTPQHPDLHAIDFSPDGTILASAGCAQENIGKPCIIGEVRLWDVSTGAQQKGPPPQAGGAMLSVAFAPLTDTLRLAAGGEGRSVDVWEVSTEGFVASTSPSKPLNSAVQSLAYSGTGRNLAAAGADGTIVVWDMVAEAQVGPPLRGHGSRVTGLAYSYNGNYLASSGSDGTVLLWQSSASDALSQIQPFGGATINSLAFNPSNDILAAGSCGRLDASGSKCIDGVVRIVNLRDNRWVEDARGLTLSGSGAIQSLVFAPDRETLAVASDDRGLMLLGDLTSPVLEPRVTHTLTLAPDNLVFAPQGDLLATSDQSGTIMLFPDAGSGEGKVLGRPDSRTLALAFKDSNTLLVAGSDEHLTQFSLQGSDWVSKTIKPRGDSTRVETFAPDGTWLATVGTNNGGANTSQIQFWRTDNGEPIGDAIDSEIQQVTVMAFGPFKQLLATASVDKAISLWDITTRQRVGIPLAGHFDTISDLVFSGDGKWLASAGTDGTLIVWDLRMEAWRATACRVANRNPSMVEWHRFSNLLEEEQRLCPDLPLHPSFLRNEIDLANEARSKGDQSAERDALRRAADIAKYVGDGEALDRACRLGALDGFSELVMPICERALLLGQNAPRYLDSRGIAHALAGNPEQAIADFTAFVEWARAGVGYEAATSQRENWIAELRAGRSPFNELTLQLQALHDEGGLQVIPVATATAIATTVPDATQTTLVTIATESAQAGLGNANATNLAHTAIAVQSTETALVATAFAAATTTSVAEMQQTSLAATAEINAAAGETAAAIATENALATVVAGQTAVAAVATENAAATAAAATIGAAATATSVAMVSPTLLPTPTSVTVGKPTGQIAYASDRENPARLTQLYIMNADGTNQRRLEVSNTHDLYPDWSPDGTSIVYQKSRAECADVSQGPPAGDLYIIDPRTGDKIRQLTTSVCARWPRWSPDGLWIAFAAGPPKQNSGRNIYRIPAKGGPIEQLTDTQEGDGYPAWTRDSKGLVFGRREGKDIQLYSINEADNWRLVRLTSAPGGHAFPDISPDGKRIAFEWDKAGNDDIYTMALDGTDIQQVTKNPSADRYPRWSPDGHWIAFHSNQSSKGYNIWVVPVLTSGNADGDLIRLTNNDYYNDVPAWGR